MSISNHTHLSTVEERFKKGCYWNGLAVYKKGFPDFLIEKDGRILFVEIKSKSDPMLSIQQFEMFKRLQKAGIDIAVCYDGDINEIYKFDEYFGLSIKDYYDRYHDADYKGKKPERIDMEKLLIGLTLDNIRKMNSLLSSAKN